MSPRHSSSQRKGCCDPKPEDPRGDHGGPNHCEEVCQSVAVLGSAPLLPRLELATAFASCRVENLSPLLILAIDHVPLL